MVGSPQFKKGEVKDGDFESELQGTWSKRKWHKESDCFPEDDEGPQRKWHSGDREWKGDRATKQLKL